MASTEVERDLLLGLLALQIGMIEQDQLVTAFRTWTRDRSRPIADLLVGRGDLDLEQPRASRAWLPCTSRSTEATSRRVWRPCPRGGPRMRSSPGWATPTSRPPLAMSAPVTA